MTETPTTLYTPRHRRNAVDLDSHQHFIASAQRALIGYQPRHRQGLHVVTEVQA